MADPQVKNLLDNLTQQDLKRLAELLRPHLTPEISLREVDTATGRRLQNIPDARVIRFHSRLDGTVEVKHGLGKKPKGFIPYAGHPDAAPRIVRADKEKVVFQTKGGVGEVEGIIF